MRWISRLVPMSLVLGLWSEINDLIQSVTYVRNYNWKISIIFVTSHKDNPGKIHKSITVFGSKQYICAKCGVFNLLFPQLTYVNRVDTGQNGIYVLYFHVLMPCQRINTPHSCTGLRDTILLISDLLY